eukprot:21291-Heterococcus_DN1.PRE.1
MTHTDAGLVQEADATTQAAPVVRNLLVAQEQPAQSITAKVPEIMTSRSAKRSKISNDLRDGGSAVPADVSDDTEANTVEEDDDAAPDEVGSIHDIVLTCMIVGSGSIKALIIKNLMHYMFWHNCTPNRKNLFRSATLRSMTVMVVMDAPHPSQQAKAKTREQQTAHHAETRLPTVHAHAAASCSSAESTGSACVHALAQLTHALRYHTALHTIMSEQYCEEFACERRMCSDCTAVLAKGVAGMRRGRRSFSHAGVTAARKAAAAAAATTAADATADTAGADGDSAADDDTAAAAAAAASEAAADAAAED